MSTKKKALYISEEVTPYLKESFIGRICQELPGRVQENGYEARTFMPKYGCINERRNQLHEVIRLSGLNLPVDDTDHPLIIKVATLQSSRMQVYFIDNDEYFQHHAVTDLEIRETPADNDERVIFFTRGVMETVKKLRWEPTVIHCSGWITVLSPLYLRRAYADDPTVGSAKVVYSIFDDAFEGGLNPRFRQKLGLDGFTDEDTDILGDEPVDWVTMNKLAIKYSDGVVAGTENVPAELLDYARSLGKAVLEFHPDLDKDAAPIVEFYQNL